MKDLPGNVCPYCEEEMRRGFLTNRGYQLKWMPDGEKEGITVFSGKEGIPLNRFCFARNHKIEAYYCEHCHKVIIDTNFIE